LADNKFSLKSRLMISALLYTIICCPPATGIACMQGL